jgi:hypothetical protein
VSMSMYECVGEDVRGSLSGYECVGGLRWPSLGLRRPSLAAAVSSSS